MCAITEALLATWTIAGAVAVASLAAAAVTSVACRLLDAAITKVLGDW